MDSSKNWFPILVCLTLGIILTPAYGERANPGRMRMNAYDIKEEQAQLAKSLREEAEKYKKAAEKEKGPLAETLYTLVQSCSEEASLREKLSDAASSRNLGEYDAYRKRLESLQARVKGLREKALAQGYKEESFQKKSHGEAIGDPSNPNIEKLLIALPMQARRVKNEAERNQNLLASDTPDISKVRMEYIKHLEAFGEVLETIYKEVQSSNSTEPYERQEAVLKTYKDNGDAFRRELTQSAPTANIRSAFKNRRDRKREKEQDAAPVEKSSGVRVDSPEKFSEILDQ